MANLAHHSLAETAVAELGGIIDLPPVTDLENIEIPLGVNYGLVCGPVFETKIVQKQNGQEQRMMIRTQAKWQFQAGERTMTRRELNDLQQFHRQRMGMKIGFLARDWGDYKMPRQTIAVADGTTGDYSLYKSYGDYKRRIKKPITGTVKHWVNGSPGDATVNYDEGRLIFPNNPPAGASIEAECEFLIPVRFATDLLQAEFRAHEKDSNKSIFWLSSLPIVETEVSTEQQIITPITARSYDQLDIGIDYDSIGGGRYRTSITKKGNAEARDSFWDRDLGDWQIGERVYDKSELDHLITMFLNHRGRARVFMYRDWGDDTLERTTIGTGDGFITQFTIDRFSGIYNLPRRNVSLPVLETVEVWLDGDLQTSGYTVGREPGTIQFTTPPASGATIECACRFMKRARFGLDTLSYRFVAKEGDKSLFVAGATPVVEVMP